MIICEKSKLSRCDTHLWQSTLVKICL